MHSCYVLLDAFFLVFYLVVFSLVGLPITRLIRGVRVPFLLAPTLGYAIVGVAATVLYACGLPIRVVFGILVFTGAFSAVMLRRQLVAAGRAVLVRPPENRVILPLAIALAGALLLLLPKWTGGPQYAVFQGNPGDTSAYLTCSMVCAHQPFDTARSACFSSCIPEELHAVSRLHLALRPTVMILYAVVGQLSPSNMLELHYTYLVFFRFCAALVLGWFFLNLAVPVTNRQRMLVWAAAFAFSLGFWGQYILNSNAWAQISTIPVLAALVGLLLLLARPPDPASDHALQLHWPNGLAVALLVAGAVYLYPENAEFHLATLVPVFLVLLFWGNRTIVLQLALAIVVGLFTMLLFMHGSLIVYMMQQTFGQGTSLDINWWIASCRFYFGYDGWFDTLEGNLRHLWEKAQPGVHDNGAAQLTFAWSYIEDFFRQGQNWRLLAGLPFTALAGFAGLFFLTPLATWPWSLQILDYVLLSTLSVALVWNGVRALSRSVVRTHLHWLAGIMLAMAVFLLFRRQVWAAGKAVSFLSPYLAVIFLCPLFLSTKRWPRLLAGAWLASQLAFGCIQPLWATLHDVPHTSTYETFPVVRKTYDFDFRPLTTALRQARCVRLDISDPVVEQYLMLFLYCHDIPFRIQRPTPAGHKQRSMPGEWSLTIGTEPNPTGLRSVIAHPPSGTPLGNVMEDR